MPPDLSSVRSLRVRLLLPLSLVLAVVGHRHRRLSLAVAPRRRHVDGRALHDRDHHHHHRLRRDQAAHHRRPPVHDRARGDRYRQHVLHPRRGHGVPGQRPAGRSRGEASHGASDRPAVLARDRGRHGPRGNAGRAGAARGGRPVRGDRRPRERHPARAGARLPGPGRRRLAGRGAGAGRHPARPWPHRHHRRRRHQRLRGALGAGAEPRALHRGPRAPTRPASPSCSAPAPTARSAPTRSAATGSRT